MKRNFVLSLAILLITSASVNAEIYSYGFTTAGPIGTVAQFHNINTAGAVGRARAFYVTGDWSVAGGDPWSNEFRTQLVGVTDVGGGALERGHGGVGSGSPFTFGHPTVATWQNNITTSPAGHGYATMLANQATSDLGGAFSLGLRQTFAGSSTNLANAQVHFLTDCMAPVAFDTAATGLTMIQRPSSLTTLAAAGTYTYDTLTFTAPATGVKHLAMHISPAFDGFLLVYGPGGFDATNPLTNLIGLDDVGSLGDFNSSDLFLGVTAGQQYTLVATTFSSTPTGGGVSGIFTVAGVPEPSAMLLVGAVISALSYRRRRNG